MRRALLVTPSLIVALASIAVVVTPDGIEAVRPAIPGLKLIVAALCGALLLVDRIGLRGRARGQAYAAIRDGLLIALALSSFLLWTHFASVYRLESFHRWEFFNHFLSAKYFDELGYTRLYDCVLVADQLAGEGPPLAERAVRRLANYRVEAGKTALAASWDCPELFTSERWQSFQQDVAFFRSSMQPSRWARVLTDHGMNATPAWLVAGSWLANRGPASPGLVGLIFWLDPLLLATLFGASAWAFGWRPTAIALVFFGTFAPNDVEWTGRSYLRFDWLAATVIGVALLKRGQYKASGALLSLGALLRVVPAFLIASLLLSVALGLLRSKSFRVPRRWWRFATGAAATVVVVVSLSALSTGGFGSWLDFADNSRLHLEAPLLNFVGWPMVVGYEHASRLERMRDPTAPDPFHRWKERRNEILERRAPLYALGVLCFVVLLVRARGWSDDWTMAVLGVGGMVMTSSVGAYYYALLLVYALLWPRNPAAGIGLCLLAVLSRIAAASSGPLDEVYTWTSLAAVLFVLGATAVGPAAGPDQESS